MRAAYRLHDSLRKLGLRSTMVVGKRSSDDPDVVGPSRYLERTWVHVAERIDSLPLSIYRRRSNKLFQLRWAPNGSVARIRNGTPQIVQLHHFAGGTLRVSDLPRIRVPFVWRLSDMWPFTGGCVYSGACRRYTNQCGACPHLASDMPHDLSSRVHHRKRNVYRKIDLTVVAPSRWMADCASSSSLFRSVPIEVIPTGTNLDVYKPIDRNEARRLLGLPRDTNLVLFGAQSALVDERKGAHLLRAAIATLAVKHTAARTRPQLLVFGASRPSADPEFGLPVHYQGTLHDDVALMLTYNAADVFVVPSVEDNLPNTALEAIACGTPVVAFDIGGMSDIVDHRVNGYLAKPFATDNLAEGIEYCLAANRAPMRVAARNKALDRFSLDRQAKNYQSLYERILNRASELS